MSVAKENYKENDSDTKPWGTCRVVKVTDKTCKRVIVINPHCGLSLQSHQHRAERWQVVHGILTTVIGTELVFLKSSDKTPTTVLPTVLYAMVNSTDEPVTVIEEQFGDCSESDIIRYRDPYGRACDEFDNQNLDLLKSVCLYDSIIKCLKPNS